MTLKRFFILSAIPLGLVVGAKPGVADPGWRIVWSEWCFMESVQRAQGSAGLGDYSRPVPVSCFSASQNGIGLDRTFSIWSDSWLTSRFLDSREHAFSAGIGSAPLALQLFARALGLTLSGPYTKNPSHDRPGSGECVPRSAAVSGQVPCLPDEGPGQIPNHTAPEPATLALLGTGLAGVLGMKRKRLAN